MHSVSNLILEDTLPVEEIRERDIDLLLLEEITVSDGFRSFLLGQVGIQSAGSFIGCYHSLTQERGESDLVIKFAGNRNRGLLILIENKIDALFTDRQAERYFERGHSYIKHQDCEQFITVLVAPSGFLSSSHGFEFSVSYECIRDWFRNQNDARSAFKILMLDCAIKKHRRGYQRIANDAVTTFQHQFYELSQSIYPELCFRRPPDVVPSGSGFLYCEPEVLKPRGIKIVHKFFAKQAFNAVDLQFHGRGVNIDDFIDEFGSFISDEMAIVRVSNSAAVRYKLKRLETQGSFEDQRADLILSIEYAKRLYDWALSHVLKKTSIPT